MREFEGRHILLGVSGSIATYKAVALASRLTQAGATVDVIMTDSATRMVQPLSFQAITHRQVLTDMWSLVAETEIGHVTLAREADALLVAPATANTIAKISLGMADNYLTTTALALRGALVIAPAMESGMYRHPATVEHLERLATRGATIIEPGSGYLASGASGVGRLADEEVILASLARALGPRDLAGLHVVVTAGGTREAIDPVRFVTNRSSGRMGHALAAAAARRGAVVTLISAAGLDAPHDVTLERVESAEEMRDAVARALPSADVLLMAAAVADYRPAERAEHKIKKGDDDLALALVRTPDILLSTRNLRPEGLTVVGWAAESHDLIANARGKLERKGLDLVVANPVPQSFGDGRVEATLVRADGEIPLEPMDKPRLADRILDELLRLRGVAQTKQD